MCKPIILLFVGWGDHLTGVLRGFRSFCKIDEHDCIGVGGVSRAAVAFLVLMLYVQDRNTSIV